MNASKEANFEDDLVQDVLEIITVFSARLYGARSRKNKKLLETLKDAASKHLRAILPIRRVLSLDEIRSPFSLNMRLSWAKSKEHSLLRSAARQRSSDLKS